MTKDRRLRLAVYIFCVAALLKASMIHPGNWLVVAVAWIAFVMAFVGFVYAKDEDE